MNLKEIATRVGTPYFLSKPYRYEQVIAVMNRALSEHPRPPKSRVALVARPSGEALGRVSAMIQGRVSAMIQGRVGCESTGIVPFIYLAFRMDSETESTGTDPSGRAVEQLRPRAVMVCFVCPLHGSQNMILGIQWNRHPVGRRT
jgi:hypothetical protein